ncbi:dual specificity protein phosphatase 19-like [Amphiura filiformis]|uniref:dual specificity protein phosphatase 19-like n=1 Tax=Amphiura filiformis TaxID=82378 RepID=UPI003B2232CF
MAFLGEITKFNKKSLQNVETQITTPAGQRILESHSTDWDKISKQVTDEGTLGFIGDYKPDLQVLEVRPRLFLSSQDVAASLDLLQEHNITHILNVASLVENSFPAMFTYKTCKILDLPEVPITRHFDECFQFIETGLSEGGILVHCNAGRSRSVTIVTAYLMKTERITLDVILKEMKEQRPGVQPNPGFMMQLKEYEKNVLGDQ